MAKVSSLGDTAWGSPQTLGPQCFIFGDQEAGFWTGRILLLLLLPPSVGLSQPIQCHFLLAYYVEGPSRCLLI